MGKPGRPAFHFLCLLANVLEVWLPSANFDVECGSVSRGKEKVLDVMVTSSPTCGS